MRIVFFLLCILAFLAGAGVQAVAQSAIHEIEAFILYLISAVFFVGAGIVEAVNNARKRLEPTIQSVADTSRATAETIRALREQLVSASSSSPAPSQTLYYYTTDGQQQGPLSAADLRGMRKDGLIADDTPVLRDGESQWRTYRDFLALNR